MVLVWDNSTQPKDALMRELLAAHRQWLTVFRLPAYAPELNPAEGMWANLKNYLGNLAARTVDTLADLTRNRLKKMQYRPDLVDGFIAETGLTWTLPRRHPKAKTSVAIFVPVVRPCSMLRPGSRRARTRGKLVPGTLDRAEGNRGGELSATARPNRWRVDPPRCPSAVRR
ncbi:transposase [Streptomyces sp. NPDC050619]|uniref:transposase n=1 Tax=Streptomyces sp. NPDC050619 TaxID=3157214 RepID=UPI0034274E31